MSFRNACPASHTSQNACRPIRSTTAVSPVVETRPAAKDKNAPATLLFQKALIISVSPVLCSTNNKFFTPSAKQKLESENI